jgi:general secretion pathway protein A
MYEKFFGFKTRPFQMAPDPQFLFLSAQHRGALLQLEYAMTHEAPFCLITGEVGSGKTTLIRHLLNRTEASVTVGLINNTSRNIRRLMEWVSLAFDLPFERRSDVSLRKQFEEFLIREYAAGRKCVLIVDEAQNLGRRNLEELRLLSNINADDHLVLQIILVGQPELRKVLADPRLRQVAQRISVEFHLGTLSMEESGHYIRHRLRVAGGPLSTFSSNAVRLIYLRSGGVPRLINRLCDLSLVHAYSQGVQRVGHSIVGEVTGTVAAELQPESVRSV